MVRFNAKPGRNDIKFRQVADPSNQEQRTREEKALSQIFFNLITDLRGGQPDDSDHDALYYFIGLGISRQSDLPLARLLHETGEGFVQHDGPRHADEAAQTRALVRYIAGNILIGDCTGRCHLNQRQRADLESLCSHMMQEQKKIPGAKKYPGMQHTR